MRKALVAPISPLRANRLALCASIAVLRLSLYSERAIELQLLYPVLSAKPSTDSSSRLEGLGGVAHES